MGLDPIAINWSARWLRINSYKIGEFEKKIKVLVS